MDPYREERAVLFLRFDRDALLPEQLQAHLQVFAIRQKGTPMPGQPILFNRNTDPYYYYTFTNRGVLERVTAFLRERGVELDVVGKNELPDYAKQFLKGFQSRRR